MANSKGSVISLDLKSLITVRHKAARYLQPHKVINAQKKYSLHECCALWVVEHLSVPIIKAKTVHLVIIIHTEKILCIVVFNVRL